MSDVILFISLVIILGLTSLILLFRAFLDIVSNFVMKKRHKAFNGLICNKLKNGLLSNQSDIQVLFNAFVSEHDNNSFFHFPLSLVQMLENFYLSTEILEESDKNLIMSFIQNEVKLMPFVGVPPEERVILTSICNNLDKEKDSLLIDNLNQLGIAMAARYEGYKRKDKLSKWSLGIAIIGTLGTIVGVILAILQWGN